MSSDINLIAFGTFGNPNGFKQTFFKGSKELAKSIRTFDLKTDAIKLFPGNKVYAIRKESANNFNVISYAVYSFAKEQNSERGGTFIGSGILFVNQIAEENITISLLNEFQQNLVSNNTQNDIITVNHSDQFSVSKLKDFDKLEHNLRDLKDLNFEKFSSTNLVVYTELNSNKLQQSLKKAIEILNVYDTIYFTESVEVAEFVHRQGLFKLVQIDGFELEIEKYRNEKKQFLDSIIAEFEEEKKIAEVQKTKWLEKQKKQIADSEKVHKENGLKIDEAKNALNNANQKFISYHKKIDDAVLQLKSGKNPEKIRQTLDGNKRAFTESLLQLSSEIRLEDVTKSHSGTEIKQGWQPKSEEYYKNKEDQKDQQNRGSGFDIYKVFSFTLLLLLGGTFVYFLYFDSQRNNKQIAAYRTPIKVAGEFVIPRAPTPQLNPKPNYELGKQEYELLAQKPIRLMEVKQIAQILFDTYPAEIKNIYANQLEIYAGHLVELNRNCFDENNKLFYFARDTIRHIPAYQDPAKVLEDK
ncbi:MAG: hypothetical protein IPI60_19145 [Saprospiraceae bacterium]|nr:hypothetical protein [Saprospiraceae bacterium]